MVLSFYRDIFQDDGVCEPFCFKGCFPRLEASCLEEMRKDVSEEDIKKVVFSIGSFKARKKMDISCFSINFSVQLLGHISVGFLDRFLLIQRRLVRLIKL